MKRIKVNIQGSWVATGTSIWYISEIIILYVSVKYKFGTKHFFWILELQKTQIQKIENCEKPAVKHSIEKPILLNFINLYIICCPRYICCTYSGSRLSIHYKKTKDRTIKEHQHDVVYYVKCSKEICMEDYRLAKMHEDCLSGTYKVKSRIWWNIHFKASKNSQTFMALTI